MSRTISKTIGLVCVAATALALSVSTQASTKHKHRKPTVNEPSGKSFRYDSRKNFGHKNKRSSFVRSNIRGSHVGFPFAQGYGIGANTNLPVDTNGSSIVMADGSSEPLGLQITGTYFEKRPGAKIIHVSDELKTLGEERAERRRARLNSGDDNRVFRFYRANEAYDVRFPSVVYLKSD